MTATLRSHDTTRVALPDLTLDQYRAIVARIQAEPDADRARIARGLQVLLGCEIRETETLGVYLIQSCQDSGLYYRATTWGCTCPDRMRHDVPCKHSYGLQVLSAASAQAAYERAQAGWVLTQKGMAATKPVA